MARDGLDIARRQLAEQERQSRRAYLREILWLLHGVSDEIRGSANLDRLSALMRRLQSHRLDQELPIVAHFATRGWTTPGHQNEIGHLIDQAIAEVGEAIRSADEGGTAGPSR